MRHGHQMPAIRTGEHGGVVIAAVWIGREGIVAVFSDDVVLVFGQW